MRRVKLFELIRRDHDQGLSKRAVARKYQIHRRVVRQAIASSVPPERKCPVRPRPTLTEDARAFIDGARPSTSLGGTDSSMVESSPSLTPTSPKRSSQFPYGLDSPVTHNDA